MTSQPQATAAAYQQALVAAVDGLIWHALDHAGRKLRRSPACPRAQRWRANRVDAAQLHTVLPVTREQVDLWRLLDDTVWTRVPEIADRYDIDSGRLTAALDSYVRELIAAGVAHEYQQVPAVLRTAGLNSRGTVDG